MSRQVLPQKQEKSMNDFFESLRKAVAIPSQGSVFIKNDNTLDKYIFEPVVPTSINKMTSSTSTIFNPVLSPVKEVEETEETEKLYEYNGGSPDSKLEVDKAMQKAESDLASEAPLLKTRPEIKVEVVEPKDMIQKKSWWKFW